MDLSPGAVGVINEIWDTRIRFFGIGAMDPLTLIAVVGVLGFSALLACLAPALRAARIDPIETLKAE